VERGGKFHDLPWTINVILLTNAALSNAAMARAIITVTEAKTAVLQDMDVRSSYNPQVQATGTGTDNVAVVSGDGSLIRYSGGHTVMGNMIAHATKEAIFEAIQRQNGITL